VAVRKINKVLISDSIGRKEIKFLLKEITEMPSDRQFPIACWV
jgi:hypothetical protein